MTEPMRLAPLDESSPTPLYHQISERIRALIDEGVFVPGDQLPSERIIAEDLGVSRMTVRQAVRSMVAEGWAERRRGLGVFVRRRPVLVDPQNFEGFTSNIQRQGLVARTLPLGSSVVASDPAIAERLEIVPGEPVVELKRLRLIGEVPAVLETEWFPEAGFHDLVGADMSQSLYAILDRQFGVQLGSTSDVLRAHRLTAEEAGLLRLAPESPVILRDRIGYVADGTPIEVVRSVYHPEQYEFRMTLTPIRPGA